MKDPLKQKRRDTDFLLEYAISEIKAGRARSIRDLAKSLGTAHRIFRDHGIDVGQIFKEYNVIRKNYEWSSDELVELARKTFLQHKRYCTTHELEEFLGITRGLFKRHKVPLKQIAEECGFKVDAIKVRTLSTSKEKQQLLKEMEDTYRRLIKERGSAVSPHALVDIYKIDKATAWKRIGGWDNVLKIHAELGIEYRFHPKRPSKDEVIALCSEAILEHKRYLTGDQLSHIVNVPVMYIKDAFRVPELNHSLGYSRKNWGFEDSVFSILKTLDVDIERQKRFSDLVSNKGRRLPFDFYLPSLNILVESDGPQHWRKTNRFHSERLLETDALKNQYCKDKGIVLIRIRYSGIVRPGYIKRCCRDTVLYDLFPPELEETGPTSY